MIKIKLTNSNKFDLLTDHYLHTLSTGKFVKFLTFISINYVNFLTFLYIMIYPFVILRGVIVVCCFVLYYNRVININKMHIKYRRYKFKLYDY